MAHECVLQGAGRRLLAGPLLGVVLVGALLANTALLAQDLSGHIELRAGWSDLLSRAADGGAIERESFTLFQRYSVNASWQLFPNLRLAAGGLFEQTDTSTDLNGVDLPDGELQRLQPYLNLTLQNKLYSAEFRYRRLEDRFGGTGGTATEVQDSYSAIFGWRPERLPRVRFRAQLSETHDGTREITDTKLTLNELRLEQTLYGRLRLFYKGLIDELENRLEDLEVRRTSHTARATFGDSWWSNRLQLSADFLRLDQRNEIRGSAGGEVLTPALIASGLSGLSELPEDVVLAENPALIDDNRSASAGIDLGLEETGGDDRSRNIGIDLGIETAVDILWVSIDREIPPQIATSFRWEIYSSRDNREWLVEETVNLSQYNRFDRRFELRFSQVSARYLKVVTSPLARAVPGATEFPEIFVTEVEAFQLTPADQAGSEFTSYTETVSTSLRGRLLKSHSLFYEFASTDRRKEGAPSTSQISHGLSFSEQLTPKLTLSARASREESESVGRDLLTYPYSASLRANWLPTLEQRLVFSGREDETEGEERSDRSLFLFTAAELYRGVNADLILAIGEQDTVAGDRSDFTQISANASLTPHPSLAVNARYYRREENLSSGSLSPEQERSRSRRELNATFTPFPAIYLFGSYRLEGATGAQDRTVRNYGLGWTPFQGGNLQLSFRYDETYQSQVDSLFKVYSPRVRWNITSRWYAELAWESATLDAERQESENEVFTLSSRLAF